MPRTAAPDGPGERVALLCRTTIELRKQLENAASVSGRSLSQEAEKRLEKTFDLEYLMGDSETALVLRAIGAAIRRFELKSGKPWVEDDATQEAAFEAASAILDAIMKPRRVDAAFAPAIPVDPNDRYMRLGFKTMALDRAMEELRTYRNLKERELIHSRPATPR